MTKDEMKKVCRQAVGKWGEEAQLRQAQEEAAELIVAINHYLRGRALSLDHLVRELADMRIMMEQLEFILAIEGKTADYERRIESMIESLQEKINK